MSWQAVVWAKLWRLGEANRKAVLLVTAEYANSKKGPDGQPVPEGQAVCWQPIDTIAADAEVSARTVRRLFAGFEAVGVIRRERRHDRRGHRQPDAVWLALDQLPRDVAAALDKFLADHRGTEGLAAHNGAARRSVDNSADGPADDPRSDPPSGPGGPGLAAPAVTGPSGPQWSAQVPAIEPAEEPLPTGLPTQPPTARAGDDDGRRYATAKAELQRLPDLGNALIEEVRGALPGKPDLMTLVITAGDLSRERRRRTG
jgi:hypothetical protein